MEEMTFSVKNIVSPEVEKKQKLFKNSRKDRDWAIHWDENWVFVGIHGVEVYNSVNKRFYQNILVADIEKKIRFVNQMANLSITHIVFSSTLKREQANSKREENSDDDDRSFWRRTSISDASGSSKREKNHVDPMKNHMYRAKAVLSHEKILKIIPRNRNYQGWSFSAKNFEIDVEDDASLRSTKREKSRWSCTLEYTEINIAQKGSRDKGAEKCTESQWKNYNFRWEHCDISQNDLIYRSCDAGTLRRENIFCLS